MAYRKVTAEVKELAAELLAAGHKAIAVARMLNIHRHTIRNWMNDDSEFSDRVMSGRLTNARIIVQNVQNLEHIALSPLQSGSTRIRASLELLKALQPETWDSTTRRRHIEAEQPELFDSGIIKQKHMDERDKRLQEEAAAKELAIAQEQKGESPSVQLDFDEFLEDLRMVQEEAGAEAAKQADDYEEDDGQAGRDNNPT